MKNFKALCHGIYLKLTSLNKFAQVLLLFFSKIRYLSIFLTKVWKSLIINYNVVDNCSWESSQNIGKVEFALFFSDLLLPPAHSICNVSLSTITVRGVWGGWEEDAIRSEMARLSHALFTAHRFGHQEADQEIFYSVMFFKTLEGGASLSR